MIEGYQPVVQALLATLFTWGVTALGSAMVFLCKGYKRSYLDGSLGFAAGIMIAASFWSLLVPAIEISEKYYDGNRKLACIPITIGFLIGAFFVYLTDRFIPDNYLDDAIKKTNDLNDRQNDLSQSIATTSLLTVSETSSNSTHFIVPHDSKNHVRSRIALHHGSVSHVDNSSSFIENVSYEEFDKKNNFKKYEFRKILLLIIAVTVHNIPEGLAVGVGFGAIGRSHSATFESARNLAIGIGLQNFPEGLAVSLPLYASGFSYWKSFWYGQLSGMVEPIAGIVGAYAVNIAQSILSYALAFAAGAMIYVVCDNLIPEASSSGNGKLSTWCCIIGFCVMMCLDVGFG